MSYGSDHDLDDFMAEGAITQGDEGDIEAISTPFEGFTYTIKSKYKELHGAILALSSISWRALYIQPTGKGLTFLCRNEGRSAFGKIEFEEGYFSSIYEGKAPDMSTKRPPIVKISMKNALKAFKTSIGETRNLNYMKILIDPKSDVLTLKYHSLSECVTTKTINVMGPSKAGFRSKCDEQLLTSHLSISPSTLIKCIAHIKNNEEEIIFMIEPDSFSIKRGICGMNGEDEDVICGSKSSLDLKMFAKFNVAEKSLFYVDSHELQAFLKLANGYNSLLELKFLDVGCPFILRTTNHNVIKAEFLLSTDQPRCDDDDIGDFVNSFASSNLFQSVGVGEQGKTHAPQVSNIPIHNYIQTHLVTKADVTNDLVRVKLSISHSTEKMGKKNDPDRMKERLIVEKPNANEQSFILLESNQNQVTKFEKKEAMPSSDEDPDIMNVLQNSYNSSPYELSSTGFIGRSLPSVGSQKDNGTISTLILRSYSDPDQPSPTMDRSVYMPAPAPSSGSGQSFAREEYAFTAGQQVASGGAPNAGSSGAPSRRPDVSFYLGPK
uniref:DNA damage checkpoint control protein RAD17 n=1 Tax=Rhabditophanes sp. KR3021 TaxID=114890 RepID=A0AC35TZM5_9BILA